MQPLFRNNNNSIVARHAAEPSRHLGPQGAGFQDRDHTVPPSSPLCPRRNSKQGKNNAGSTTKAANLDKAGRLRLGGRTVWFLFWNPGAIGTPVQARAPCSHCLEPTTTASSHVMLQNPAGTSGHRGLDSRTRTTQSLHPAPYVPDEVPNRAKSSAGCITKAPNLDKAGRLRLGGRTVLVPVLEPRRDWHAGAGQSTVQPLFKTSNISIVARHAVEPSRHLGPQGAGFQNRNRTVLPSSPLCPRRSSKQGKNNAGNTTKAANLDKAGRLRLGGRTVWPLSWNPGAIGTPVQARAPCSHCLKPATSASSHAML
ncbi:hypothetical protein CCAE64S_01278 [Castellaniella caeni]